MPANLATLAVLRSQRKEVLDGIAEIEDNRTVEPADGNETLSQGKVQALKEILAEIEAKIAVAQSDAQ